jgi:4-amino-4-deoxy-L-arabinose transferase-like glycosyltransferase
MNKKIKVSLAVIAILIVASFFRLWQLESIPPGLYPDVAMNGTNVLENLRSGHLQIFYPENNGREGFFMWLIALAFKIFGVSIWSLKFAGAFLGIMTILGIYLLTKELLKKTVFSENREYVALLSSFLMAVSFWHTLMSRIGFRAISLPFILVFTFCFFFKGLHDKKLAYFIISGGLFGLGFYTYTSVRLAPAIFLVLAIIYFFLFLREKLLKKYLLFAGTFSLFTILAALPLGLYFLNHKEDFISRAAPISVFAAANPLHALLQSLVLHLGMLNFYGDPNWRHNFAGAPMLPPALGILFIIGLVFSFFMVFKSLKNKAVLKNENFTVGLFLISWWFVMLLPGILTYEGMPHALRTIGIMPAVFILVSMGGFWLYEKLKRFINKKFLLTLSIIFLVFLASSEFYKYFYLWAENPKVSEAYNTNYANMGNYLNSLPDNVKKYVVVNEPGSPFWGISIAAQTPIFIESAKFGKPRAQYIPFDNINYIQTGTEDVVVIPLYEKSLPGLTEKFPQGEIEQMKDFSVYFIPKNN